MLSKPPNNSTFEPSRQTRNSLQKEESLSFARIRPILSEIESCWPPQDWLGAQVLVAVSGGPDSVALLRILHDCKKQTGATDGGLQLVHVNHGVRGDRDVDENFVLNLANQLGVKAHLVRCPTPTSPGEAPSEQSLREMRYRHMLTTAKQLGIRLLATAHTLDDQIETILFRLIRGTGIDGLQGIPVVRVQDGVSIVRPLLGVKKSELLELLNDWNQPFCVDQTNAASDYSRNYLRNQVIPLIEAKFGNRLAHSVARISEQAVEHVDFLDQLTEPWIAKVDGHYSVQELARQHPVLVTHALRRMWREACLKEAGMTAEKWQQLNQFVCSTHDGTLQLPGKVTVKLKNKWLSFSTSD